MKNRTVQKIGLIGLMLAMGAITYPAAQQQEGPSSLKNIIIERCLNGRLPITPDEFEALPIDRQDDLINGLIKVNSNNDVDKALFNAAEKNLAWAVTPLLVRGANIEAFDRNGNTALMLAAEKRHSAVLGQLISAGANVNARDLGSYTALIWAAIEGNDTIVGQLMVAGANVDAAGRYGDTALMNAAGSGNNGHYEIAKKLFEANPYSALITNKSGQKAIDIAVRSGHTEIVTLLSTALGDIVYTPSPSDKKSSDDRYLLLDEKKLEAEATQAIAALFANGPVKRSVSNDTGEGPAAKRARKNHPQAVDSDE